MTLGGLTWPMIRLLEIARNSTSAARRARWQIINEDYQKLRNAFARIAEQAPEGSADKEAWMISSLSTVWGVKMEGLLSLALRFQGYSPIAVYLHHDAWSVRYHNVFKLDRSIYFVSLNPNSDPEVTPEIATFIKSKPKTSDLLAFEVRGVAIGRIALSNYLNRNKFSKFDINDADTLQELETELARVRRNVTAARKLIERRRPKVALLLEKGLSPMAELFGVLVAAGIPVIQYAGSQKTNSFVFKRYSMSNRYQHPFSLDQETWAKVRGMPWTKVHEDDLMGEFAASYKDGTWFNRKFLHQGKQIKSAEDVRMQLGLDPSKKTAVIFSHVLWDATFFYGEGLFEDYETWLLETIRVACGNSRVNWVIKLHPDLMWKLKYENYTGELRDTIAIRSSVGTLPDHVKLVLPETDISSYSFFAITDYCLTVRGTIGIEMACHGVPVITAGTGRYSGLGFTFDSSNKETYLERVADIQNVPPMSSKQIELARRFAYALFRQRLWVAESTDTVKLPMDQTGHPLDHNLLLRLSSYSELTRARDLREFAEWADSSAIDYMNSENRVCVESPA